jgi:hypothetical protein
MREVPAQDWMNGRKHFDAALVQRLVDRARELDPAGKSGQVDAGCVDVRNVSAGLGGPSRYGVAIAAAGP